MKRIVIAALLLGAASCSNKPEASGTNTNWLRACASAEECGPSSSCSCGLCTRACSTDAECAPGVCGSALATNNQCGGPEALPICLPEGPNAGTCSEFPIPADGDLAVSAGAPCDVPGALLCEGFDGPLPPEHSTWYSGGSTPPSKTAAFTEALGRSTIRPSRSASPKRACGWERACRRVHSLRDFTRTSHRR